MGGVKYANLSNEVGIGNMIWGMDGTETDMEPYKELP